MRSALASLSAASGRVFAEFLGDDLGERTLYHGHSFGGNALAAAVALRHLELIEAWDVLTNVRERSDELAGLLHDRIAPKPVVREVRLRGLMRERGVSLVHTHSSVDSWLGGVAAKSLGDRNPKAQIENKFTVRTAYYAAAVRPGDFDLLQFLRVWVFLNKHNGVLANIYKKYTELALVELPAL